MSRWNRLLLLLLVYDPAPKPIQSASTWPLTLANSIAPRCFEDDIGVRELENLLIYFGVPRFHETAISQFNQFNVLIWPACKTLWIWVQFSCKHHLKKLEWHKDLVHLCSAQCVLNHPSKDFESIWKHNTWIKRQVFDCQTVQSAVFAYYPLHDVEPVLGQSPRAKKATPSQLYKASKRTTPWIWEVSKFGQCMQVIFSFLLDDSSVEQKNPFAVLRPSRFLVLWIQFQEWVFLDRRAATLGVMHVSGRRQQVVRLVHTRLIQHDRPKLSTQLGAKI